LLLPPPLPLLCPSAPPAAADEAAASPATVRFFTPSVISSTTIVTVPPRCAAPAVSVVEGRVWFGSGLKFLFSALAAGLERVKRGCEMRPGLKLNQCYMGFKGPPFSGATPQVFGPQSIGPSSCANCEFFSSKESIRDNAHFIAKTVCRDPGAPTRPAPAMGQPSGSNDDRAPER
jgi:hypothetical protein